MGRTLRVSLLGCKVQEARRYHVQISVQSPSDLASATEAYALRCDKVARTETAGFSQHPEFTNRSFILRLSHSLGHSLSVRLLLHCALFAATAPSMSSMCQQAALEAVSGLDELVGSGVLAVVGPALARLLRGERCTLAVPLLQGAAGQGCGEAQVWSCCWSCCCWTLRCPCRRTCTPPQVEGVGGAWLALPLPRDPSCQTLPASAAP
ncbi:hypothetical protein V8C86DRAFT_2884688 [Haematococcus lacustris]